MIYSILSSKNSWKALNGVGQKNAPVISNKTQTKQATVSKDVFDSYNGVIYTELMHGPLIFNNESVHSKHQIIENENERWHKTISRIT